MSPRSRLLWPASLSALAVAVALYSSQGLPAPRLADGAAPCSGGVEGTEVGPALGVARPERRSQVYLRRYFLKRAVIQELFRGDRTLREAAAQFKWLNEAPNPGPGTPAITFLDPGEEERLCRQVITWVRGERTLASSSFVDAQVQRLEEELESHVGTHKGDSSPFGKRSYAHPR